MRITLTLDKDVYRKLLSETRWTGRSFSKIEQLLDKLDPPVLR
jgi:predicted CopG family antitoxin